MIRLVDEVEKADGDLNAAISRLQGTLASLDDPADTEALLQLLGALYDAGRRDLPLGRLFEGHVDALQIIRRYGGPHIAEDAHCRARRGATFGVWNADLPGEPLTLDHGRLNGGKSFASGAGLLTHALVTADTAGGRQLLLIDLNDACPGIDRDWWDVVGMARSLTHIVRWEDAPLASAALIGAPGDYAREPWFSGGALRFVAVHAGGIAAILDHARAHLMATGRGLPDIDHQIGQRRRAHFRQTGLALGDALSTKRAAIGRYRTQTGAITDDPAGFAISASERWRFSRPIERFEEASRCARSR